MVTSATRDQISLVPRPIRNPKHEIALNKSLDVEIHDSVATKGAVAFAGATKGAGQLHALRFELADGWILEVPMTERVIEQLRHVIGTMEAGQ